MAQSALNFPLYERAEALGVLDGESALIVAPTATGKYPPSSRGDLSCARPRCPGTHVYLVPFPALATRATARGARKEPPI